MDRLVGIVGITLAVGLVANCGGPSPPPRAPAKPAPSGIAAPTPTPTPPTPTPPVPTPSLAPSAQLQWTSQGVVEIDDSTPLDFAITDDKICRLFASGQVTCVDASTRARTELFAANPALALRQELKLRAAGDLICLQTRWSVMCRTFADPRVAEVHTPRDNWRLDPVKRQLCTAQQCISLEPGKLALPVEITDVDRDSAAYTARNHWALARCSGTDDKCLSCEGRGVCAKWRYAWDTMHIGPKIITRGTGCVNGPNTVERCPPPPPPKRIVISEAAKGAAIAKHWGLVDDAVPWGVVATFAKLDYDSRLVANENAVCILQRKTAHCATTWVMPHDVQLPSKWRNDDVFLWGSHACLLEADQFKISCMDIEGNAGLRTIGLPSTTQMQRYQGTVAVGVQRLCYDDPSGGIACITANKNAAPELFAANEFGAAPTGGVRPAKRSYVGDPTGADIRVAGEFLCNVESCSHSQAKQVVPREQARTSITALRLGANETMEFANYETRPRDNGVLACAPPKPRRTAVNELERVEPVSLQSAPLGRSGNLRCTNGHDGGVDVLVPNGWRLRMWGDAVCDANGSVVACRLVRDGGRVEWTVEVGFKIESIDTSSHLLCVNPEAGAVGAVCWRREPGSQGFAPERIVVPALTGADRAR